MLGHVQVFGALHVPPFEQVGEQTAIRQKSISEYISYYRNISLRVVHRVPLYVEGQVQVPGLEQVPPFEQLGVQIGRVHRAPLYVEGHVQTPGLEHVPPFEQLGEHTAEHNRIQSFTAKITVDLRMVHVAPVCDVVHVHVLGALQVPLF